VDIRAQNQAIWPELQAALEPVLTGAQFILGPAVERFESHFADYIGVRHCIGLNNGTSALHLALRAFDIGPGDEVITTPHSWISTSWAINYVGAKPVFVDIDPVTYTLDPELAERAITKNTKAILPVHLYGQAADLEPLMRLAQAHGLTMIEDAAQAHGAKYNGRRLGSFGHAACFSFYPGKNLGAFGEAGAVVTNDDDRARRIRRLRDHAQDGRHHHTEVGYNMRMEGIQGCVLDVKLRHLEAWNVRRTRHANLYRQLLAEVSGLVMPVAPRPESHVWHLFVVLVDGAEREQLRRELADAGVGTAVHYPTPIPLQPAFASLGHRPGDFPVAERVMSQCLSLPMYPELTEAQIEHTAHVLGKALSIHRTAPVDERLVASRMLDEP
jgi:dTDP-4-amino-4,6-dideoxygalactose transaminase